MKLDYKNKVLFKYRRKQIIDENFITNKRNEKDKERWLKDSHIVEIFRRIIDYLLERGQSYLYDGRKYLFYSRQYDIGLIVDIKDVDNKPQIFIRTWLKDIMNVEKKKSLLRDEKSFYILNQKCWDYLYNIADNPKIGKYKGKKDITELIINDCDDNKIKLEVMCLGGKVWHITNLEICEVY